MEPALRADPAPPSTAYAEHGRVQIPDVLDAASVRELHRCLSTQSAWNLVTTQNGQHVDLAGDGLAHMSAEQRRAFLSSVYGAASSGFQYLYKTVPVYDEVHRGAFRDHPFGALFRFLNGSDFLDFARTLTGEPDIGFCDVQATRYEPGHFLTAHDDDVHGKDRVAAFVLGLTADWRTDWGGLLQFHDGNGDLEGAWRPRMNVLNVFRVPQPHAVSLVAPWAGAARLSFTGWLRRGTDPLAS